VATKKNEPAAEATETQSDSDRVDMNTPAALIPLQSEEEVSEAAQEEQG